MISTNQLRSIMPTLKEDRAAEFVSPINDATIAFGIDQSDKRMAPFLANVAHETLELLRTREIWGPTAAQAGYEGRANLGNTQPGDGRKFMGRGLLQITGRSNYHDCSIALYSDDRLLEEPELLEEPAGASLAGAWFWQAHGLNPIADADHFEAICRIINGGTNGMDKRIEYLRRAKLALGMSSAIG